MYLACRTQVAKIPSLITECQVRGCTPLPILYPIHPLKSARIGIFHLSLSWVNNLLQTVCKVWGQFGKFEDSLKSFRTVWKFSRLSRKFLTFGVSDVRQRVQPAGLYFEELEWEGIFCNCWIPTEVLGGATSPSSVCQLPSFNTSSSFFR